ncbi:putative transcription factor MYB-HB-like family [Helianthus annuus]|nr:putative transcription factor MYB-HB-like family [Helianthus annuus]
MYSGIHSIMPLEDFPRPNLVGDPCLVLTTDPKPRLRWTAEFHERFVDAVTQLGGPDKATPKMIMRTMGVKGLTLYHLKSHLQKYRMGKQSCKEFSDNSKEGIILTSNHLELTIPMTSQDMGSSTSSSTRMMPQDLNDGFEVIEALRVQMEIQRILHEQLEDVNKLFEQPRVTLAMDALKNGIESYQEGKGVQKNIGGVSCFFNYTTCG